MEDLSTEKGGENVALSDSEEKQCLFHDLTEGHERDLRVRYF
jgi:hypothetical protein